ncbi:C4-dicarboxylate ABC transporter substrate-binding protein [Pueribacillus theae]|uniref:C4-dicarboxylate ABC transporter substrate-binding protein n=1 Tax=Pueribacillus theae TaxID=2171751 RepID=A0A2U1JW48_9BACI|nr:TAXI family TRAP transporter solute-binding subunit [Pueribacillus theae]PWA09215.1 C4-dicarboxylate ABC transporter substrate-binding protein [Pueribacillus theae]
MAKKLFLSIITVIFLLALAACGSDSGDQKASTENNKEEKTGGEASLDKVAVSVYDVGSSGYAEFSAVANALTQEYGMQIRLLPSGNGVGRMTPLRDGTATFGRLGDEYQFAFEGTEEFAANSWGPQNMTVIWPSMTHINGVVLKESGIEKPADLKGKKVPHITAGASINVKTEGFLAAGGLTWDDVKAVEITSYAAQADALKQGQIDVAFMLPGAAALLEVEQAKGIQWMTLPDDVNSDEWKAIQEAAPWLVPEKWGVGAGLSEGPQTFMAYPYPLVSYADVDEDIVYELMTRIHDTFDSYKDATSGTQQWGIDKINTTPLGVPFHDGAVKFFKEHDLWDDEKEEQNNALKERQKKLAEAWETVIDEASEKGISESDFPDFWFERKAELVK